MTLTLSSPDFHDGQPMPRDLTCDGKDQSPALAWAGLPAGTRSLALTIADPDAPDPQAPVREWVHWVVYDVPPSVTHLARGVTRLPDGARSGLNDWRRTGYGGPCPPIGRHRYVHTLTALDVVLPDLVHPTKAQLEAAMAGHVLARARLVGTFQRGD